MERGGGLLTDLERDLPLLLTAAHGFTADHGSVDDFTESALGWYKNHSSEIGAWAEASLIVFSFTPSSAAAERVFSLLKALFRIQPGHGPRRLHPRVHDGPLQRHEARDLVLRGKRVREIER